VKAEAATPDLTDWANDGGYELDDQIGYLLRLAVQRHTAIFMARMVDDLTQQQFAVLARLHQVRSCSQNHLGRLVALDVATIKGVVDRLQSRGLVSSSSEDSGRRRKYIELTKKGLKTIKRAEIVAAKITADTLTPLSPGECSEILRLLRKLI
jgi:DNA-binding MarR family transcriptional regulator